MDDNSNNFLLRVGVREVEAAFRPVGGFAPAIGCMDERVIRLSETDSRSPMVRLAGAGGLIGPDLASAVLEMTDVVRRLKLKYVAYHSDCGAGELMARVGGKHPSEGDDLAREFAESVAKTACVKTVRSPLDGPVGHHVALCHYYCGVPFAPHMVTELPTGFVTSRFVTDGEYGKRELVIAAGIALGEHGLGQFSTKSPYRIVVVATNGEELARLLVEARAAVTSLPARMRRRIAVEGFVAS